MSNSHFSSYISPNIIIVPTVSFCGPPPKKQKPNNEPQPVTDLIPIVPVQNKKPCAAVHPVQSNTDGTKCLNENIIGSVPIQGNSFNLCCPKDTSNSLEDSEERVKKTLSWASNFLQSIGKSKAKVTKPINSANQKLFPILNEGIPQNANKPQSSLNTIQKNLLANEGKNKSTMNIDLSENNKYNLKATKYPIKGNLLNNQKQTDPCSDKARVQIATTSKLPNITKPNFENTDKMGDKKVSVNDLTRQNNVKTADRILLDSHAKPSGIDKLNKGKCNKDVRNNGNSIMTKNKCVKKYADINEDRNKISTDSKSVGKSNDRHKSYKSEHKTKAELQASERIQNHSKAHYCSKDELEASASNRIKTNSGKLEYTHSNQPHSKNRNRVDEKTDISKVNSREPKSKKESVGEHKSKSRLSAKRKHDDYKNKSQPSAKPIDNSCRKSSEISLSKPIKSVVQVTNKYENVEDLRKKLKMPEKCHDVEDLRSKLKRKYKNSPPIKRDNLIITLSNDSNGKEDIPGLKTEKNQNTEKKTKKYKKIKLVIHVVCESSESDSDNNENNEVPSTNVDLSFLDDFNVDDIVDSLNNEEDTANNNQNLPSIGESKNTTEMLLNNNSIKKCDDLQNRFDTVSSELKPDPIHKLEEHGVVENKFEDKKDENFKASKITAIQVIQALNNISGDGHVIESQLSGCCNSISLTDDSFKPILTQNKLDNYYNKNEIHDLELGSETKNTNDSLAKLKVASNNNDKEFENNSNLQHDTNVRKVTNPSEKQIKEIDLTIINLPHEKTSMLNGTGKKIQNTVNPQPIQAKPKQSKPNTGIRTVNNLIDLTLSPEKTNKINKHTSNEIKLDIEKTSKNQVPGAELKEKALIIIDDTKNQIAIPSQLQYNASNVPLKIDNKIIYLTAEQTTSVKNEVTKTHDHDNAYHMSKDHAVKERLEAIIIDSQSTDITSESSSVVTTSSYNNITVSDQNKINWALSPKSLKHDSNKTSSDFPAIKDVNKEHATKLEITNEQILEISGASVNEIKHNVLAYPDINDTEETKNKSNITLLTEISEECQDGINKVFQNNIINQDTCVNIIKVQQIEIKKHKENRSSIHVDTNVQPTTIVSETQNYIVNKESQEIIQRHSNQKDTEKTLNNISEDVLISDIRDENLTSYKSEATDSDKTPIYNPKQSDKTSDTIEINPEPQSKLTDTSNEDQPRNDANEDKNDYVPNNKFKKTQEMLALENRMGQYLRSQYNIEFLIKHGKFSKIFLCKDENGRDYALKVLHKGKRMAGCRIEDMLKNLQKDIPRRNYNCVYLINGFAMMDHWCFLMDYYPKNLQQVLKENGKCFHINAVQLLARQLVSAVLILRNNNIMHLDVKPSHVLINSSNDRLKLAGFDESQYLEGLSVLPCVGTVNYRPPEVIMGYPYFGKIDVWSTALVIYEMCTARQLFPGCYNNDILYKQQCTLGMLPNEIVIQSVFTNYHYRGGNFARRYGHAGQQCVLVHSFKKSMRLPTSLLKAYNRDWKSTRTRKQMADDLAKLRTLCDLLEEMLIMDPNRRTPIEFVYANSFIYETYDFRV